MDIRAQFETAAGNAAYAYINYIRQLADNPLIRDAIDNAPIHLTKGRQLEDIVLDDMMDRFAGVMSSAQDTRIVPNTFFYWLMTQRYGSENVSLQESDGELANATRQMKRKMIPDALPTFLQILESSISGTELAKLTNQWNDVFTKVVRLSTSDDALRVYSRNINTQNAMVEVANNAIALKAKNTAKKVGNGGLGGKSGGGSANDDDDDDDDSDFLDKIAENLKQLNMPENIKTEVWKLFKQTRRLNPQMSEFSVNCKRLEIITSLPWGVFKDMNSDINEAQEILDDDHYGLEKVKEQIIQHMAVQNRTGAPDGKIMLLVGPPGVGKTSIARSVAKATGREYIRISLGGVSKESDIRGHSSTFVGAMPGRIIQEIRKAKSSNPLVVLDEIDKLGQGGAHGDPSAALLEVLDPAQNHTFRDDYLGVEFDLSKVLFFATANDFANIPGPLRDRMQVIHLRGYTKDEKFEIAQRYLVPKQMKAKKLSNEELVITPEAVRTLISHHTTEAGVRTLEKKIGEICGKTVVDLAKGKEGLTTVAPENLEDFVGVGHGGRDKIPAVDMVGVVNGLAYSSVGGSVLPIEVAVNNSAGFKITVTGNLGKVMGESASVAESLVRSRAPQFGIRDAYLNKSELRIHAPEGAIPKDGPSAGAAFTTAIISALTHIPIRRDVAMTGEINLRGEVTAIGGLPEKLEGALDAGVKTVLIPKQNIPHLKEVPEAIRSKLTIIPVGTIEEVLQHALTSKIEPVVETAPKPLTFGVRLRKAWNLVVNNVSNDNQPQPVQVRQAAGAHPNDPKPF